MKLYRHKSNTDVAVEVLRKYYIPETDTYKLKVVWHRISFSRNKGLYSLGAKQKLKIKRKEWLTMWELFPKH